jgi:hypothetical protein
MAGVVAPRSSSSSSSSSSSATNSRVSPANPPPMPEAEQLEAARRLATRALSELSRHDMSSSTSPPCGLPALLRRCLQLLPLLNAGDPSLAARCCRGLLASLGAILSRKPSPSLLPSLEVLVNCPLCSWLRQFLYERFRNLFEVSIAPFHLNVL